MFLWKKFDVSKIFLFQNTERKSVAAPSKDQRLVNSNGREATAT